MEGYDRPEKHLAVFKKVGCKIESHRPSNNDAYVGLTNRENWVIASQEPVYEPAGLIGIFKQNNIFQAESRG